MSIVASAAASVVLFFLCVNINGVALVVFFKRNKQKEQCCHVSLVSGLETIVVISLDDSLVPPPAQFGSLVMSHL